MENYKYYILDKGNKNVSGVISDDGGLIMYEALMIKDVFNEFTNGYQKELVKFHESPIREVDANRLSEYFESVEITKEYWTAYKHAGGGNRKAISESTES